MGGKKSKPALPHDVSYQPKYVINTNEGGPNLIRKSGLLVIKNHYLKYCASWYEIHMNFFLRCLILRN